MNFNVKLIFIIVLLVLFVSIAVYYFNFVSCPADSCIPATIHFKPNVTESQAKTLLESSGLRGCILAPPEVWKKFSGWANCNIPATSPRIEEGLNNSGLVEYISYNVI